MWLSRNNLSTTERLGLFVQVCQAIQHAHQKGIIHRDIKPSNILVTLHDGVPVPKVIDFGIAKATTGQPLTDKTVYTAVDQFIGTPAYMSPEQAELSGLDIDTRNDIYALGVLLYELLTGKTPFDAKRLVEAGLDEIRRIIREEDPPRPSTRISTLDAAEQTSIAKKHSSEPPKLSGLIRGDLDWIVMKTLEKDRTLRYETANGLGMDIERHLSSKPIIARPQSSLYKFGKFARRHKIALTASFVIVLLLLVAAAVSASWAIRAEQAEKRARIESEKNRAALEILGGAGSKPKQSSENAGEEKVRRSILGAAGDREVEEFKRTMLERIGNVKLPEMASHLKGVVIVPSRDRVSLAGTPVNRGVIVRGPVFLKTEAFEREMTRFLRQPLTDATITEIKASIVSFCQKVGQPDADVMFPEQYIAEGAIQIVVSSANGLTKGKKTTGSKGL